MNILRSRMYAERLGIDSDKALNTSHVYIDFNYII